MIKRVGQTLPQYTAFVLWLGPFHSECVCDPSESFMMNRRVLQEVPWALRHSLYSPANATDVWWRCSAHTGCMLNGEYITEVTEDYFSFHCYHLWRLNLLKFIVGLPRLTRWRCMDGVLKCSTQVLYLFISPVDHLYYSGFLATAKMCCFFRQIVHFQ